jgi:beta propeller repeat protein
MGQRSRRVVALALASTLLTTGIATGSISYAERRVTDEAYGQWDPIVSGDKVIWHDNLVGDLWGEDFVTGVEWSLGATPVDPHDIDGDLVVWSDSRFGAGNAIEIYAYDIPTGSARRITSDSVWQGSPAVSGDRIVYADETEGADRDVFLYNFRMGTLTTFTPDAWVQDYPDISGDIVVWEDDRNGNFDIYAYDLNTGTEKRLTTDTNWQRWPSICGNLVAWYDDRDGHGEIYAYDLTTDTEFRVTNANSSKSAPHVGEDYITWEDDRLGTYDVFAYDIDAGQVTDVVARSDDQRLPSTSGGFFAWYDDRNHAGAFDDIYLADADLEWSRAAGGNRWATAVDIAQEHPTFGDNVAIVATGEDFPDALSAAGLAGIFDAPLFLVGQNSVPSEVRVELARRDVSWIIIVGGKAAVGDTVFNWLDARYPGVHRVWGTNRYDTAKEVATYMSTIMGGGGHVNALIARGDSFPDALALSPIAYARGMPILLTDPNALPSVTANALSSMNVQRAAIAGGTSAVSGPVQGDIDTILGNNGGSGSFRWPGSDRYATAATVAKEAVDINWLNTGFVGIATGLSFPDALTGGIACGNEHGVLLLSQTDSLPSATVQYLTQHEQGICQVQGFGGNKVLEDSVLDQAVSHVN